MLAGTAAIIRATILPTSTIGSNCQSVVKCFTGLAESLFSSAIDKKCVLNSLAMMKLLRPSSLLKAGWMAFKAGR